VGTTRPGSITGGWAQQNHKDGRGYVQDPREHRGRDSHFYNRGQDRCHLSQEVSIRGDTVHASEKQPLQNEGAEQSGMKA
jgi:hypothetical protein